MFNKHRTTSTRSSSVLLQCGQGVNVIRVVLRVICIKYKHLIPNHRIPQQNQHTLIDLSQSVEEQSKYIYQGK